MLLLTGKPHIGKSTAIKKIINCLGHENCGGFWTEEIIKENEELRTGFMIHTFDGNSGILADVNYTSDLRISRYGVNIEEFEKLCLPALETAIRDKEYVIIDEIGPMQVFSKKYQNILYKLLNSNKKIIGTIFHDSHPWLDEFKKQKSIKLYELTKENRDTLWL